MAHGTHEDSSARASEAGTEAADQGAFVGQDSVVGTRQPIWELQTQQMLMVLGHVVSADNTQQGVGLAFLALSGFLELEHLPVACWLIQGSQGSGVKCEGLAPCPGVVRQQLWGWDSGVQRRGHSMEDSYMGYQGWNLGWPHARQASSSLLFYLSSPIGGSF